MQQMYSLQQTIPHHCIQKSEYRCKTYTPTQYILTQYKSTSLNVKPQNTKWQFEKLDDIGFADEL